MTTPRLLHEHELRKISLLRALQRMNRTAYYPRITELVKYEDGRPIIPRATMEARRRYIKVLLTRGLAAWTEDAAGHPVRLCITGAGEDALIALEK